MNEESRPGQEAALTRTNAPSLPPSYVEDRRLAWVSAIMDRRTTNDLPVYGSLPWSFLSNGHPDQVAATVVAAEAWHDRERTLVGEFRAWLERDRASRKRSDDADYVASWQGRRDARRGRGGAR